MPVKPATNLAPQSPEELTWKLNNAFNRGETAGRNRAKYRDNPFDRHVDPSLHKAWGNGRYFGSWQRAIEKQEERDRREKEKQKREEQDE